MTLALVYAIFCILFILSAIYSHTQKKTVFVLLFIITAFVSALFAISRTASEPIATITGWASIVIAIATLTAFGLASVMPKEKRET